MLRGAKKPVRIGKRGSLSAGTDCNESFLEGGAAFIVVRYRAERRTESRAGLTG